MFSVWAWDISCKICRHKPRKVPTKFAAEFQFFRIGARIGFLLPKFASGTDLLFPTVNRYSCFAMAQCPALWVIRVSEGRVTEQLCGQNMQIKMIEDSGSVE